MAWWIISTATFTIIMPSKLHRPTRAAQAHNSAAHKKYFILFVIMYIDLYYNYCNILHAHMRAPARAQEGEQVKKRIGSKLYDTGSAICILQEQKLFRTQHKQTYFIYDGSNITPVSYEDAAAMIDKYGGKTERTYLYRSGNRHGTSTVNLSTDHADRLAAYCREHEISQKKVIEDFIDSLTK